MAYGKRRVRRRVGLARRKTGARRVYKQRRSVRRPGRLSSRKSFGLRRYRGTVRKRYASGRAKASRNGTGGFRNLKRGAWSVRPRTVTTRPYPARPLSRTLSRKGFLTLSRGVKPGSGPVFPPSVYRVCSYRRAPVLLQCGAYGMSDTMLPVNMVDYLIDEAIVGTIMPFVVSASSAFDVFPQTASYSFANGYNQIASFYRSNRCDGCKITIDIDNSFVGQYGTLNVIGREFSRMTTKDLQFILVFTYSAQSGVNGNESPALDTLTYGDFLKRGYFQRAVHVLPAGEGYQKALVYPAGIPTTGNAEGLMAATIGNSVTSHKTIKLQLAVDFKKLLGTYYDPAQFTGSATVAPPAYNKMNLTLFAFCPRNGLGTQLATDIQYCTARLNIEYNMQFFEPSSTYQAFAYGPEV